MKNTLTGILIGISLTFVSLKTNAQEHNGHKHQMKHSPEMMLTKLDSELNLNEIQEKRVFDLFHKVIPSFRLKKGFC